MFFSFSYDEQRLKCYFTVRLKFSVMRLLNNFWINMEFVQGKRYLTAPLLQSHSIRRTVKIMQLIKDNASLAYTELNSKQLRCKINVSVLTHFISMFHSFTPWKHQIRFGFLTFSGVIEIENWTKMGEN